MVLEPNSSIQSVCISSIHRSKISCSVCGDSISNGFIDKNLSRPCIWAAVIERLMLVIVSSLYRVRSSKKIVKILLESSSLSCMIMLIPTLSDSEN